MYTNASISFLKQSKSAIVANTYEDICTELQKIIQNNEIIDDYSTKMYDFSKNLFDLDIIREYIYKDIIELLSLKQ